MTIDPATHIPGPWFVDPDPIEGDSGGRHYAVSNGENGGYLIANCPEQAGAGRHNAALVAAAPTMLAALARLLDALAAQPTRVFTGDLADAIGHADGVARGVAGRRP